MSEDDLLNHSLVEIKLGNYGVATSTALNDPSLLSTVRHYKRQIASRMYPLGREDIARKIPDSEYHVSRKIDGEFTVLIYRNGELLTLNPGGTIRIGLPFQIEAKNLLEASGIEQAVIAGELYVTNQDGRRPRVHDVASVVRQPTSRAELDRVQFAVFDLISINGVPVETGYVDVWQQIDATFAAGSSIHPVETRVVKAASRHRNAISEVGRGRRRRRTGCSYRFRRQL